MNVKGALKHATPCYTVAKLSTWGGRMCATLENVKQMFAHKQCVSVSQTHSLCGLTNMKY